MPLDSTTPEQSLLSPHPLQGRATDLSTARVLLGILKSIENELRKRELLPLISPPPTPLWFLAETERNVFLWRSNQSLDDARRYSFWVDIAALITKRQEQLKRPEEFNPFINPLWGSAPLDAALVERERDYLEALEELMPTVFRRAGSLSRASETLRLEIDPEATRTAVVIPLARAVSPSFTRQSPL